MLGKNLFDVEHSLNLFAYSFVHFPAWAIYDEENLKNLRATIKDCHIYLIGLVPSLNLNEISQHGNQLHYDFSVLGITKKVAYPIPSDLHLRFCDDYWYLENDQGNRFMPINHDFLMTIYHRLQCPSFDVQYVGQAFGKDGERDIIARLKNHETLQRISLQGIPSGYRLEIILVEVHPDTRVITMFSPVDEEAEVTKQRIARGIDKLFNTNEQEMVAIYEACLIRYFQPRFNIEFKGSFPSTRMKILKDCYDKEFISIVADFCFDEFPYLLCS